MRVALMELFQMHHSETRYGVPSSDRLELFEKARELGFDGIEFGLRCDYTQDPLWTGDGDLRQAMRAASEKTGVEACSLCLHLLNYREHSPASEDAAHRATGREIIMHALVACQEIGASVILVPFFGTATLRTREQMALVIREMRSCASVAESVGVRLALETSLDARTTLALLEQIDSDAVQVYFDTGNTVGLEYDILREIEALGTRIAQVHVKDHPATPVLGAGCIDFEQVFQALDRVGFREVLVLEVPTSDDATAQANLAYVRRVVEA